MTIENDSNLLPLEYSEVEVARRLFRSGESECYINKNSCRLKDIHELFVDTGMSSNAYSVIELKMIETILSNDSSNFKKMLDEAAGISNYNQQRRSTQNTLKRTLNDLDRINDIIYEIEKNIKNLNLQLKRYKRHEVLIEKLKEKEILKSALNILLIEKEEKPILKGLEGKDSEQLDIEKQLEKEEKLFKDFEKKHNLKKIEISNIKNEIHKNNNILHLSNTSIIKFTENKKYNNSQVEYCIDQFRQSQLTINHINEKVDFLKNELKEIDPVILSQNKDFIIFEKKYIKEKKKRETLIDQIEKEKDVFNHLYSLLSDSKNKKKFIDSEQMSLIKHLSDLEKFKYDKNCKYCVKNGSQQIDEKKDIKLKSSELSKELSKSISEFNKINKNYTKQSKKIEKLNKEIISYDRENSKTDQKFQDFKIKNIELNKEKEGLEYRLDSFLNSKKDFEIKIKDFNKKENLLDDENKKLDQKILEETKKTNTTNLTLKNLISKENKVEISYDKESIKLKNIQQNMMLNQRKKESKIIDKQNFEIKLSDFSNQKKIIENFIKDRYACDIYDYINIQNKNIDLDSLSYEIKKIKTSIENIGPINMAVKIEHEKEKERFDFLNEQKKDLTDSEGTLQKTIKKLDKEAKIKFLTSFNVINQNLSKTFSMFFNGGEACLKLLNDADPLESDIEIIAKPPGKKNKTLKMLSAGEKALSATAILFAIYLKKPSPFCILDEIDSPLDDNNIKKFTDVIKSFSNKTQFIIITHNKLTMQESDYMYGITQEEDGISKLVSVKLEK